MLTERLREFAMRYTAAWCSQDPASVAAFFSPEGSLQINDGLPAVGRAAITESARAFMTDFPDLHVAMDNLVQDGGRIEYHWTLTGTYHPGKMQKIVRISGFERWQFGDDGLIAASLGQFDLADYQRQTAEKLRPHGAPSSAGNRISN